MTYTCTAGTVNLIINHISVVCMLPLQAQLRRELNEEKFKNEVLTKLVYMFICTSLGAPSLVKYQLYVCYERVVYIACKYSVNDYGKTYNHG